MSFTYHQTLKSLSLPLYFADIQSSIEALTLNVCEQSVLKHVTCVGANCMAISLANGRRATLSKVDAFADGVAVKSVSSHRSLLYVRTVFENYYFYSYVGLGMSV